MGPDGQWRFDRRPWTPGQADEDIAWALGRLEAATTIWDKDLAGTDGLTHPDFERVSTARLWHWLEWWSDPARSQEADEAGRTPAQEVAKIQAELDARDARSTAGSGNE